MDRNGSFTGILISGASQLVTSWTCNTCNMLEYQRLVLVHNEALSLEHGCISVLDTSLGPADSIIELILKLHVLESIVANQERSELLFIEFDKPVNEGAIDPGSWLTKKEVRRASAPII